MEITAFNGCAGCEMTGLNLMNYRQPISKGQVEEPTFDQQLQTASDAFLQTALSSLEPSSSADYTPPPPAVPVWESSAGWVSSRAAGILSILIYSNPGLVSYQDVLDFLSYNGLTPENPSLLPSDSRLVGQSGNLYLKSNWEWPANWSELWDRWAAGEIIANLPAKPSAPVTPGTTAPVTPGPNQSNFDKLIALALIAAM